MNRSFSAGGVVLNKNTQVLVVSQSGTSWSLPKGHIEPGEDELTAAKREVREESGITDIELVKPIGKYQRSSIGVNGEEDKSELKIISLFLFKVTGDDSLNPCDPQNPEARWVDIGSVPSLLTHPRDKEFFENVVMPILQQR